MKIYNVIYKREILTELESNEPRPLCNLAAV